MGKNNSREELYPCEGCESRYWIPDQQNIADLLFDIHKSKPIWEFEVYDPVTPRKQERTLVFHGFSHKDCISDLFKNISYKPNVE